MICPVNTVWPAEHIEAGHVSVERLDAVAVIDDHFPPVPVAESGGYDDAIAGGSYGCAERRGNIDALMELAFTGAEDRIHTLAEA